MAIDSRPGQAAAARGESAASPLMSRVLRLYRRLPPGLRAPVSRAVWRFRLRTLAWPRLPEVRETPAPGDDIRDDRAAPIGVRLFGYFSGEFGLGESARLYARALRAAGVPVQVRDLDIDLPHVHRRRNFPNSAFEGVRRVVDLVVVNPDYLDRAKDLLPTGADRGDVTVGCWFWELERLPMQWRRAASSFDALLAASTFVASAMCASVDIPVITVPLPVVDANVPTLGRRDFGLPEGRFLFLTMFDFHSSASRKNPIATIDAFRAAFPRGDERVALVIKTSNGRHYPEKLKALADHAKSDARIIVRDGVLSGSQLRCLQACADAVVSLHRAEGFGLVLAEAMALGKPVVATGWSGNLDFMSDATARLVRHRPVAVQAGEYPDAEGAHWADPDVAHAAELMAALADDPSAATALGACAAASVRAALDPASVGRALRDEFVRLVATARRTAEEK